MRPEEIPQVPQVPKQYQYSPQPSPRDHRPTYTVTVHEYAHTITTSQLTLDQVAKLILVMGEQFAREQVAVPLDDRHSLYVEISSEEGEEQERWEEVQVGTLSKG